MKRFFRNNGLSITWLGLFFTVFIFGQIISGMKEYNRDQIEHGEKPAEFMEYITSSHFAEATMENWESEFLQMFLFVALTAFLYQKGSAESKKIDEKEEVDKDPRFYKVSKDAPWPVRKGGVILRIYEYSLSLVLLFIFLICFYFHAVSGAAEFNQEIAEHHGTERVTVTGYLTTSKFWFESFQNWQSEFLSVGAMVIFTIFLRQRGSPESKPVDAPSSKTGKD